MFQKSNGVSLFDLITEFNFYPVRYIHLSWLKRDEHFRLIGRLKSSATTQFNLSSYLLGRYKVDGVFDFDFRRLEKRVVFASAEEIEKLAFYLGLVLNENVIRSVVRKDERIALKKCLGESAFQFAVKKAQFISRASVSTGPSLLIDWNHLDRFRMFLKTSGFQVIATAFRDAPVGFRKRLALKMPQGLQKILNDTGSITMDGSQCARLVIKTHREVNRQWRHLLS